MPASWKTYDATVRLLAAIVAAHPGFKFDYAAMAAWLDDGTTANALQHVFRPIKAFAKNGPSTAEKYGEGVTGSAKKPRAPRTPSKKGKKAAASSEEGNMDDDSDMEMITPSKKSSPVKKETMNKVKGGRVEKKIVTPGRKAKTGVKNYVDSDDEGEDGDGILIKDEDLDSMDFGRAVDGDDDMLGGGFGARGNGNGHRNGGTVVGEAHDEDEDRFYDDES